jgi:hydrogenase nickel incorporation protein HypA/HybF
VHELSLMDNVRDLALEQARLHGASRIEAITLRIGALAGVEPDALRFAFEVVMAGSIAANAELRVEAVASEAFCEPCREPFAVRDGLCECPRCGAISRRLLRGRELELASLQLV